MRNDGKSIKHDVGGKRDALLHAMHFIDGNMEAQGWDLPPTLWYLLRTEYEGTPCLGLCFGRIFEEHPADGLVGTYAPDDAEVVFLATEAWSYPDEARGDAYTVAASEHPNRLECRFITAFGRDGSYEMLRHVRGEAEASIMEEVSMPANGEDAEIFGRMYEALRIHIGAKPHTDIPSTRDGLLQLQLRRVAAYLLNTLAEEQSDDEEIQVAGGLLVGTIYGTVTGDVDSLDENTRRMVDAILDQIPDGEGTWEDVRLAAIEVARAEGDDILPYYEWLDADGFAINILDMDEPRRGDEILALVPEEVRGPVAEVLRTIGLRCTGYP